MRESAFPKQGPRTQVRSVSGMGMCVRQDEIFFIFTKTFAVLFSHDTQGESEGRRPDPGHKVLIETRDFSQAFVTQWHYVGPQ